MRALLLAAILPACGDAMGPPPHDVVIVGEASEAEEAELVRSVENWNGPAGGNLFVYRGKVGHAADGRVNVFLNAKQPENQGKCFRRNPGLDSVGDVLRLDIQAGPAEDATFLRVLLMHELGHALGLEHDDDSASVMHSPAGTDQLSEADAAQARAMLMGEEKS